MKKILLLFVLLVFPVMADEVKLNVYVECPGIVKDNSEFSCNIYAESSVIVDSIELNYNFNNNFDYISFKEKNNITLNSATSKGMNASNINKSGKFDIGTLTLKIKKTGEFDINNITAKGSDKKTYNVTDIKMAIASASDVKTLDSLSIKNYEISPKFDKDIISYNAVIDSNKITINAKATDGKAKVEGTGEKTLNYGVNNFDITVTSEYGTARVYKIKVTRPDARDDNNYLKLLDTDKYKIKFDKDQTEYKFNVDYNTDTINIIAELENDKSSFIKDYGPREVPLELGENTFSIKIKNEKGDIKEYILKITRLEKELSSNNYIKLLNIKYYKLDFNKTKLDYIIYPKNIKDLDLDIILDDELSNYEIIGNSNLKVGSIIKIKVTAENGEERIYSIEIGDYYMKCSLFNNGVTFSLFLLGVAIGLFIAILIYKKRISKAEDKYYEVKVKYDELYESINPDEGNTDDNVEEEKTSL